MYFKEELMRDLGISRIIEGKRPSRMARDQSGINR